MALVRKKGFDLEAFKNGVIGITGWGRVKYAGVGAKEYLVRVIADTGESWNVTNTGKAYMDPTDSRGDIIAMLAEENPSSILSFTVKGCLCIDVARSHKTEVEGEMDDGTCVILKVDADKYRHFPIGSKVTISEGGWTK